MHWSMVFSATVAKAEEFIDRLHAAVLECRPSWDGKIRRSKRDILFPNGSRASGRSVGQATRGAHPELIVCDDILTETNSYSKYQRRKVQTWLLGTVLGMCHPGRVKTDPRSGRSYRFGPSKLHVVGTPMHASDVLMELRSNPMFVWRRYAAEFNVRDLVPGTLALEASGALPVAP
jgi:hypothetical protein